MSQMQLDANTAGLQQTVRSSPSFGNGDAGSNSITAGLQQQTLQSSPSFGDGSNSITDRNKQKKLFQLLTGITDDLRARLPLYADDWARPKSICTVLNATVFAFVIQLMPALIFAELMSSKTDGHIATAEVLLSTAVLGIMYAILAGQPLVIIGITGPMTILLGTSYGLAEKLDAQYFPFFFWTCLWASLMHMLTSVVGLVSFVWRVTPFTSQTFELFTAVTFIYSSIKDLIQPLQLADVGPFEDRSARYATLFVGLLTFYIAWTLHFAERWKFFSRQVRIVLRSYNTLIACLITTAFSYLPGVDQPMNGVGGMERVDIKVPWDWKPTWDRSWLINPLEGIGLRGIFGAIIPGFMFVLLFMIDHNVGAILTQVPKFNLKKPAAYHWDFFVLGLTFLPCAILGLPPGNAQIPQAPLHARALCTRKYEKDIDGVTREFVVNCEEQRWSALGQALLMIVALSMFQVISWIPRGTLLGLFFYLGVSVLHGNEIWERVLLCFMVKKNRPHIPVVTRVKEWRSTQCYTVLQLLCVFGIFAIAEFAPVGYIYPALLTALVPVRTHVLPRFFSEEDLKYLDPCGETEQSYFEEQREIRRAERTPSMDLDNIYYANLAAFRGAELTRQPSLDSGGAEDP